MDAAQTSFTAFDAIVIGVIIVSGIMSLSRGVMRETSSILSFSVGIVAAYLMLLLFRDPVNSITPEGWSPLIGDSILIILGFTVAYFLAASLGGQISKLIHNSPEIGTVDRIAGAVFGAARGALAIILFVLLMHMVIPADSTPAFIAKSKLYPYANGASIWLTDHIPGLVQRAQDTIPPLEAETAR